MNNPNYHVIFRDIIDKKCPEKAPEFEVLLSKKELGVMDIMDINRLIFGNNGTNDIFNQQHKNYSASDILPILDYQKKHRLNNSQLALHFKLSRNTVSKWRKCYKFLQDKALF